MDKFFANAAKGKGQPSGPPKDNPDPQDNKKQLPKGVVLGKDGKPCRSCTSVRDWMAMARGESSASRSSGAPSSTATATTTATASSPSISSASSVSAIAEYPTDCPPDVERLGNHTWTLLHTLTASYPAAASTQQQSDMKSFLGLFAKLYPCWVCAEDLDKWMRTNEGRPRLRGRQEFGTWMCEAHNQVNRKLGKEEFDCARWEERWRDGWRDGRCD